MKRFVYDTRKYLEYARYSAKSILKSEVADSHLGWFWWILDPFLFMLVYSFVAITVFGKGEKYFAAFVFIGYSSWQFFSKTILQSVRLVTQNASVVQKVYLPKYILIFIQMFINGFKMMVSYILIVGIMALYRVPVSCNLVLIIPLFAVLGMVVFGISTFMMHFGVFVDDLYNIVNVLLKLLFYLSGVFYNIYNRNIPESLAVVLLKCNPCAFIMNELRKCMIYQQAPDFLGMVAWFIIGIILSVAGVKLIYKYENSYVKVI